MKSNDVAMTFWEHLGELRKRIIISLIALGVFTVLGLSFTKPIKYVLELPLKSPITNMIANTIEAESWGRRINTWLFGTRFARWWFKC